MVKGASGFTLIELMIVAAILGILAAIAIPSYQSNVLKFQMKRSVGELAGYKTAFESQLSTTGLVTNEHLGYTPSDITTGTVSDDIATLNADGSGHLEVTLGGNAHPVLAGVVIRYERTVDGSWSCSIDKSAASQWRDAYKPDACALL